MNKKTIEEELRRLDAEAAKLERQRDALHTLLEVYGDSEPAPASRPRRKPAKPAGRARRASPNKSADVIVEATAAIKAGYTRLQEIRRRLAQHGVKLNLHALSNQLSRAVTAGALVRLKRGRYGLPSGEKRGLTATDATRAEVVRLARGGSRARPMYDALVAKFGLSLAAARWHVEEACRQGHVKRVGRGVYADPNKQLTLEV